MNMTFDNSFFESEIRCEYRVSNKTKKIWAVELDLVNELLRICKKYDIKIAGYAGTILGAVRHKGFIPWDDDIDVFLLPSEFKKLMAVPVEEYKYPYFMQNALTDRKFFIGYARFRNSETSGIVSYEKSADYNNGIFIDVFVLNGYIDNLYLYNAQSFIMHKLETLIYLYYQDLSKKNISIKRSHKIVMRCIRHLISYESLVKCHYEVQSLFDERTDRVTLLTHAKYFQERYWCYKNELLNLMDVPFENIMIPIPKEFDKILSRIYGNYMEYPPVDSRGKWHDGVITFEPDIPYKDYLLQEEKNND